MFKTFIDSLKEKDIRNRILFTIAMLLVFRIGSCIPIPGINKEYLTRIFSSDTGLLNLFDLFSGGSFSNFTLFALGVTPYITASIIMQLITYISPRMENLQKEGREGKKKINSINKYVAILLAAIQGLGLSVGMFKKAFIDFSPINVTSTVCILVGGTAMLIFLGEMINNYGLGNGMSLLIFAGIVSKVSSSIKMLYAQVKNNIIPVYGLIILVLAILIVIWVVVFIQGGLRKVPIQYADQSRGRRVMSAENSHLPIKVNTSGVIPVIFAISLIQLPVTIAYFFPNTKYANFIIKYISPNGNPGTWIYIILNVLLIMFFTYFYTAIAFKVEDISKDLKNSGAAVPGIRPGKDTCNYLAGISKRLCLIDGIFLSVIAVLPIIVSHFTPVNMTFGGTSLLIMIGVATETMKQIDTKMDSLDKRGFL